MIELTKNEGIVWIKLNVSALDRANASDLRQSASEAIDGSTTSVVVNCGALDFIDSSGVGALLHLNHLLPEDKRPVLLTNVTGPVLSVLELVRVHRLFAVQSK